MIVDDWSDLALLSKGEKVHVIRRRRFDGDLRRHFAGEITESNGSRVRAVGRTFLYDNKSTSWIRHEELRTKIFDLGHPDFIVNVLDATTDMESIRYEVDERGQLIVTDGLNLALDINEFGLHR